MVLGSEPVMSEVNLKGKLRNKSSRKGKLISRTNNERRGRLKYLHTWEAAGQGVTACRQYITVAPFPLVRTLSSCISLSKYVEIAQV